MAEESVLDPTIIIAFDFDGTLTQSDTFNCQDFVFYDKAIYYVRKIQKLPVETILWTCRHDESLAKAVNRLKDIGIEFDYINCDNKKRNSGRKINADIYIDDKANDGKIKWHKIYRKIRKIVRQRRN